MTRTRHIPPTDIATLAERVSPEPNTGCWLWLFATNRYGYALVQYNGSVKLAHRVAYEFKNGEIPKGLYALHSCDTPLCINPDHIFLGTQKDNMQDMIRKGRRHPRWRWTDGKCSRGHDLSASGTLMHRKDGRVQCRACKNEYRRVTRNTEPV